MEHRPGAECPGCHDQKKLMRDALREIAELTWNPAIGLADPSFAEIHNIARKAIESDQVKVRGK